MAVAVGVGVGFDQDRVLPDNGLLGLRVEDRDLSNRDVVERDGPVGVQRRVELPGPSRPGFRWKARPRGRKIVWKLPPGRVSERLKEPVLKTGEPARVPWVRIPPLPLGNYQLQISNCPFEKAEENVCG